MSAGHTGEVRTVNEKTGGEKGVKLARTDLLPEDALLHVAEHFGKGAAKYADRNWEKGYEWSKSYGALLRHLFLWWGGEDTDDDEVFGEFHHLDAVLFHALVLRRFADQHADLDDRPASVAKVKEYESEVSDGSGTVVNVINCG